MTAAHCQVARKNLLNVALTVRTGDPPEIGIVGTRNVGMALRVMGGNDCAPNIVWVDGPALEWDRWYEILLHIKWNPNRGIAERYLDNFSAPYCSNLNIPTLYIRLPVM
jgi:hypothetical protein